jgi:hypothetical protein
VSSACITISSLGLSSQDFENAFLIYPNPMQDKLYIEQDHKGEMSLKITDNQGRTLLRSALIQPKTELDLSQYAPGIYHIIIQQEKSILRKIIIKN